MCNIFFHTLVIILYVFVVVSSLHVLFNMTSIDTWQLWRHLLVLFRMEKMN